jgi:alginate O-acetyltransferase complex protein AlgI
MLFTSYEFIFFFLPVVVVGFFALGRINRYLASSFLVLASLFFYGWWDHQFVILLLCSIVINYFFGVSISRSRSRWLVGIAVAFNLGLLGYFKYANFFISSIARLVDAEVPALNIILPLGVSFFSFTQIAFLVDAYQGKAREYNFIHYALFVTYFPHLIAGPVLHHAQMMPQFEARSTYRPWLTHLAYGLTLFCLGLAKKVILADGIQPYVSPVFDAPAHQPLSPIEAWGGVLAYSLQLYFDFSGYSDMAIGLSRLFGITLPLNFNSPYQATNIIDFWRRWHMTLSAFLRDYLYIPLGGSRKGPGKRYFNLLTTMVLGGLWHGAGWTFVIWGALHGLFLVVNHVWQKVASRLFGKRLAAPSFGRRLVARSITLFAVSIAWVFFRATSLDTALRVVSAMFDFRAFALPAQWNQSLATSCVLAADRLCSFSVLPAFSGRELLWILGLGCIALLAPNSQSVMNLPMVARVWAQKDEGHRFHFRLGMLAGSALCLVGLLAVINGSRAVSEFIYFNF